MEVILLERIEKLGQMGDVVNVKPGYARNYLLPRKKALRASESSRAVFEQQRAQLEAENLKNRQEAERIAEIIANIARSEEEAEMQARGERINRDGDVIDIAEEEAALEAEALFEEGATPDAEELATAADAVQEATPEEVHADDAAPADDADKPTA